MRKLTAALLSLLFLLTVLCMPREAFAASSDDFFDGAVFLGDSLTVGLKSYVEDKRKSTSCLADAQFLARVSYSIAHTLEGDGYSMHPEYDGELLQPQKSLKKLDPAKVFITLGVNDVGAEASTIVENYRQLIHNIKEAVPSATLYMTAIFPMTQRKESTKRCNSVIDQLNKSLMKLAISEEIAFIDLTPALKNGSSSLDRDYSSDDYVHLNNDGYALWVKQLRAFAAFASLTGTAAAGEATIINVKNDVNARSGPGTDYGKVASIKKDETVTILENAGGNWYKVEYGGETLYVFGKYLSTAAGGRLTGKVTGVSEYANLRKGPSTESDKAGKAKAGATLELSQKYYNPGWYRVYLDGESVYISSSLIKIK